MAEVGTEFLSLLELSKRLDPDGTPAAIVELLAKKIPLMSFLKFIPGNLPRGHEATVRTGLPDSYWRIVNRGVARSHGTTAKIVESLGERTGRSELDKAAAEHGGNLAVNRLFEAKGHMMSVGHGINDGLWYGNSSITPEQPNGFMMRMSDLSAGNGGQIVDAGGTGGDNTSIVLLKTGPGLFGFYPQGSQAGIQHIDEGLTSIIDPDDANLMMPGYREWFIANAGTMLRDWRHAARVANIDVPDLQENATPADILQFMTYLTHRVEGIYEMGADESAGIFMNPTCFEMLDVQRQDRVKDGGGITWGDVDGKPVPYFRNIRIYEDDSILDTEERVV